KSGNKTAAFYRLCKKTRLYKERFRAMATKSALMTAAWVSTNILGWLLMFWMVERLRRAQAAHREERKLREELDAYAELEAIEGQRGSDRELAARVCTAIAE